MDERYDDWSLTQEEMELMNYLDSKRKTRARRTVEDIEDSYSDEDFYDWL